MGEKADGVKGDGVIGVIGVIGEKGDRIMKQKI